MKGTYFFKLIGLGMLLILFSCREEELPISLSEEKLMDVLIDMHMAEAMMNKLPSSDQDTVGEVYYRMIYREHEITKDEFDQSMNVLREDPVRLNGIYEKILERLNVLEAEERGVQKMD